MFEAHTISSEHKDVIHDISYDFYGKRMATCSSDHFVKIWDLDDQGDWLVSANFRAHSGSVWKVTWAHPEFGQVIATCSFDRTACIWEEAVGDGVNTPERVSRRWIRRTNLGDTRTAITDIKFSPKMLGLLLATSSGDGIIRIYEAPDVMNLCQWILQHEIATKLPLSCLSWNPSMFRLHPPMLAAGSDEVSSSSGGKVFIYEYSENSRRWSRSETLASITEPVHDVAFAPNIGKSYHMLAIATKDLRIITMKPLQDPNTIGQGGLARLEIQTVAQLSDHFCTVWRVCWNCTGTTLASSGDDGFVRIWKTKNMKAWKCAAVLRGDGKQAGIDVPVPAIPSLSSSTLSNSSHPTTRYYKLGTISHANQVPWH